VRELNSGHIAGCLVHNNVFVKAIIDTFSKLISSNTFSSTGEKSTEGSVLTDPNQKELGKFESKKHELSSSVKLPVFTILRSFLRKA